jgi:hypothetical protein
MITPTFSCPDSALVVLPAWNGLPLNPTFLYSNICLTVPPPRSCLALHFVLLPPNVFWKKDARDGTQGLVNAKHALYY